jgi:hypothetical protein
MMARDSAFQHTDSELRAGLTLVARADDWALSTPIRDELLHLGLIHQSNASEALFLSAEGRRTLVRLVTDR